VVRIVPGPKLNRSGVCRGLGRVLLRLPLVLVVGKGVWKWYWWRLGLTSANVVGTCRYLIALKHHDPMVSDSGDAHVSKGGGSC
jgi:hypothetical protein